MKRRAPAIGILAALLALAVFIAWWSGRGGEVRPERASPSDEPSRPAAVEPARELAAAPASAPARVPLAALQVEAAQPQQAVWPLELRGRVLDEASGLPIEGARVRASSLTVDGAQVARSAPDGTFVVEGLEHRGEEGSALGVDLRVEHPAHAVHDGRVSGEAIARADGRALALSAGDLYLATGTLVRGRVVDAENGAARAGVPLYLADLSVLFTLDDTLVRFAGETDERGEFALERIAGSSPTLHLLAVTEDAFGKAPLPVVEGLARLEGIEIALEPRGVLELELVRADGAPAAGAWAALRMAGGADLQRWHRALPFDERPWPGDPARRQLGPDGRARFACLPATAEGGEARVIAWDDEGRYIVSRPLRIGAGERKQLRLALAEPHRLERLAGRVLDFDRRPLAGARVWAGEQSTTTDERGAYELRELRSERDVWIVRAAARGYLEAAETLRARDVPGGVAEGVELALERLAPVAGLARDTLGVPLAGARLRLVRHVGAGERFAAWSTETDESGSFRFERCAAGRYTLTATELAPAEEWARECALEVEGGDEHVVFVCERLPPPTGTLEARVVDAETGEALAPLAATIQTLAGDAAELPPVPTRIQRSLGRVRVEHLHPGRYRLGVGDADGRCGFVPFQLDEPGARATIELALGGSCAIEGRVEPAERAAGAFIGARMEWVGGAWLGGAEGVLDEPSVRGRVDAQGRFRLQPPTPGPYVVELVGDGFESSARVDVLANQPVELLLRADPEATLHLTSSAPWTGGHLVLRVWIDGAPERVERVPAPDGAPLDLRLGYPPGELRWTISSTSPDAPGAGRWTGSARVAPGGTLALRLDR